MISPVLCPDEERLLGMLDCELDPSEQEDVSTHVNACVTCQGRLETLVARGLREDLKFNLLATYLREGYRESNLMLSFDEVGKMTETLLSSDNPSCPVASLDFLEPSDDPEILGRLGQYEVTQVIGRGGMGIALKARDTQLDRIVAIKVLAPELASNPTARKRFLREAKAGAAISHDHVVTVHAVQPGHLPYLAMEFIDGCSLQQKINRGGPLLVEEILRISLQTARGLAAAHDQGLIHHDIKPANIMLQNGVERVKITDFGLARAVDDVTITKTGEVRGTPQYMSPEQARGEPTDPRSDLFSLGAAMYTMCTGRPPFRSDSTMGVLHRVCNDDPRPIREINHDIPDWLVGIINRLLEKNPDDRFQSAEEVGDLLEQCLAHLQQPEVNALPTLAPSPPKRAPNRRRWYVGAIAAMLLLIGLGMGEASGVMNLGSMVLRIAFGEGTLVIEVEDPTVQVSLDGDELTISGAGIQELKLRPGQYQFLATKDGQPIEQKLVSISRGEREIVRVTRKSFSKGATRETEADAQRTTYESVPSDAFALLKTLDREGRSFGINHWVRGLAFLPSGEGLICGSCYPEIWNVETGRVRLLLTENKLLGCMSVALMPQTHVLATGHFDDGDIRLWDVETGGSIGRLKGHVANVHTLEFSSDGRFLLSGSAEPSTIRLWDVAKREEIWKQDFEAYHYAGGISSGDRIVIASEGIKIQYFDLRSGKRLREPLKAVGHVKCLDISHSGRLIASGAEDGTIQVWDLETGKETRRFLGHKGVPRDVLFLQDDRYLISGAQDRSLRLWDLESGKSVAELKADASIFTSLAVAPDGKTLATGGGHVWTKQGSSKEGDYAIRLWELPESVWPKRAVGPEKNAFVVFGTDDAEIAKFDTLAEAVLGSSSGDTIEIHGNGPFITKPVKIVHPLTVRAGEGFRPVIRDDPLSPPSRDRDALICAHAPLVLEGLEIETKHSETSKVVESFSVVLATNCRFLAQAGKFAVFLEGDTANSKLRHCELLATCPLTCRWKSASALEVEDCLLVGHINFDDWGENEEQEVEIRNCTILNDQQNCSLLNFSTYVSPKSDALRSIHFQISDSILDSASPMMRFGQTPFVEKLISPGGVESWLQSRISLQEQHNLHRIERTYLDAVTVGETDSTLTEFDIDRKGWNQLWRLKETNSQDEGIRYRGGDLHTKARLSLYQLTAEDFRLRSDSAGYQAGSDGSDLGADIDFVGPGQAYERWKKSPEYRVWRKESGEVVKTSSSWREESESDVEYDATQKAPTKTPKGESSPAGLPQHAQPASSDT